MNFRLSPKTQYNIVFWVVSLPLVPIVCILALFGLINPFYRYDVQYFVEVIVYRLCHWRNTLPIVKYYHDKAHLFDILRESNN